MILKGYTSPTKLAWSSFLSSSIGHPELVQGSSSKDFTFKPSNNSPSSPTFTAATPTMPSSGPYASSSSSMAADLAEGDWFTQQGFAELLPQIKFGHELESFVISAEYGG